MATYTAENWPAVAPFFAPNGCSPPIIQNLTPPDAGAQLASTYEQSVVVPIEFDLIAISEDWPSYVTIKFVNDKRTFLVHDGDAFLPPFDMLSTRTEIVGGFHYSLRQSGGWQADVEKLDVAKAIIP